MRNLMIIGMMGVAAFMAGWFTINRDGEHTTIQFNRDEIRQDTRRAIDKGREIIDRSNAGDSSRFADPSGQQGFPDQSFPQQDFNGSGFNGPGFQGSGFPGSGFQGQSTFPNQPGQQQPYGSQQFGNQPSGNPSQFNGQPNYGQPQNYGQPASYRDPAGFPPRYEGPSQGFPR